jgi:hypothetical protein
MHQQRPGHLADREPPRRQHGLAVAPGGYLVGAEPRPDRPAEPPGIAAVPPPGPQPAAQLVVALQHGPVHQPLGHLAARIDHERQLAAAGDAMHPALAAPAVMNAGRAERGADRERGHRVPGLMPGRAHARRPGRGERRVAAALVALPDPAVVHDRLIVIPDQPAQLRLDRGQGAPFCGFHVRLPTRSGRNLPARGYD